MLLVNRNRQVTGDIELCFFVLFVARVSEIVNVDHRTVVKTVSEC